MLANEDISDVLNTLFSSISHEKISRYEDVSEHPMLKQAAEAIDNNDMRAFWFYLSKPLNDVIDGMLKSKLPTSSDAQFIFKKYRFIQRHFAEIIEDVEGACCSVDKAKTIVRRLLNFYLTGKKISFDYNQEITYHLPEQVFTEHDTIVLFFDAIHGLEYGKSKAFVAAMAAVYASIKPRTSEEI